MVPRRCALCQPTRAPPVQLNHALERLEAVVDACMRCSRTPDLDDGGAGGGGGKPREKTATITGAIRLVRQLAIHVHQVELELGVPTR
jgi:hypothetical protein